MAEKEDLPARTVGTSSSTTTIKASERWDTKSTLSPASTASSLDSKTKQPTTIKRGPVIRDTIIGFADGLTVPFALTAAISSYVLFPPTR
jgi:hypothetical protein